MECKKSADCEAFYHDSSECFLANQTQSLAMIQGPYDCSSTKSIWLTSRLAKDYVIVETTYDHCNLITTISECEAAAQYLDLSDTSATISNNKGVVSSGKKV